MGSGVNDNFHIYSTSSRYNFQLTQQKEKEYHHQGIIQFNVMRLSIRSSRVLVDVDPHCMSINFRVTVEARRILQLLGIYYIVLNLITYLIKDRPVDNLPLHNCIILPK